MFPFQIQWKKTFAMAPKLGVRSIVGWDQVRDRAPVGQWDRGTETIGAQTIVRFVLWFGFGLSALNILRNKNKFGIWL